MLRNVDLYLKDNFFQKNEIRSKNIFLPILGDFGRSKLAGFSFNNFPTTRIVTNKTNIVIVEATIKPKSKNSLPVTSGINN
ncbi:MAG: hypothetical protein PHO06_03640 [Clostridia bacterium]|nr:hypothetical protein [Clostridia bacterium]